MTALLLLLSCKPPVESSDTDTDTPTWSADIGPILEASCLSCHRSGGAAPWTKPLARWWVPELAGYCLVDVILV